MNDFFNSVNVWQSYKQEPGYLMHFAHLANTLLKDKESARDNHVLVYNRFYFFFSQTQQLTFLNLDINNPTTP